MGHTKTLDLVSQSAKSKAVTAAGKDSGIGSRTVRDSYSRALSERGPFGPQWRLGAAATAAVGGAGHAGGGVDRRTLKHVAGNASQLGVGVGLQQKGLVAGLLIFTHDEELGVLAFELLDVLLHFMNMVIHLRKLFCRIDVDDAIYPHSVLQHI